MVIWDDLKINKMNSRDFSEISEVYCTKGNLLIVVSVILHCIEAKSVWRVSSCHHERQFQLAYAIMRGNMPCWTKIYAIFGNVTKRVFRKIQSIEKYTSDAMLRRYIFESNLTKKDLLSRLIFLFFHILSVIRNRIRVIFLEVGHFPGIHLMA